jgi:hypothetical protein
LKDEKGLLQGAKVIIPYLVLILVRTSRTISKKKNEQKNNCEEMKKKGNVMKSR